ncbi:MAG: hypothetical protein A3I12_03875 [Gammaproteobacteria bacterium RIFCSPLOWO2_02_FULL_38_11]|nr:MAG: hypothetical protein A3I12_03875 [Gammaproteobacteria bacterium RIFCSPLOWO2_02_FULL_38_11]
MTPASVPNEPQNSQALPSNNLEEIPTSNDTASTSAAAQVADERKALIKRSSEEQRIVSAVVTAYQKQQETVLSCLLDLSDDSRREMAKSFKNITEQHPFAPRPSTESQTVMSCVRDRGQRGDLKRLETLSGSYQDFCRELLTDTIVNQHTDLLRILTNAVSEKKKLGIVVVDEDKAQIELNDFHKQCEGFFEEMFRIAPVPIVSKTNVPAFSAVNRRYIPMENLASDAASSNTPAAQTPREEESPSSSSAPTAPAVSTSDVQIEEKVAVPATASSSTPAAQTPIPKEKLEAMQERYRNNHALFLQMYSDFKLPPFHNMYCVADELGNMPLHYFFEVYGGPTENRGQAEVLQMILDQRPALNRQNQNHLIPLSYARDPQSALCPVLQAWFKEQAEGLGLSSNELCRMLEGGISAISSNNLFPIIEELIDLRILTDADRHNNRNLVKFIEYVTACFSGKLTSMKTNPLKDSKPFLRDILGILEAYEKANKENAVPLDEVREEDRKKIEEARRQHRLDYQLLALSCLNILEREAKKENTKETEDRLAYLIFDLRNTSLPSSFIYEHSSFIFLILRRLFSDFRPSTFGENAVNPLYGSDVFSSPEDLSHAGIRHLNMNTAVIETHRKFNAERARHDQDWRERFDESEREHEREREEERTRHRTELALSEERTNVASRRYEEAETAAKLSDERATQSEKKATDAQTAAKLSDEKATQAQKDATDAKTESAQAKTESAQAKTESAQAKTESAQAKTESAQARREMNERLEAMAERAESEVMQARIAAAQIQKEMEAKTLQAEEKAAQTQEEMKEKLESMEKKAQADVMQMQIAAAQTQREMKEKLETTEKELKAKAAQAEEKAAQTQEEMKEKLESMEKKAQADVMQARIAAAQIQEEMKEKLETTEKELKAKAMQAEEKIVQTQKEMNERLEMTEKELKAKAAQAEEKVAQTQAEMKEKLESMAKKAETDVMQTRIAATQTQKEIIERLEIREKEAKEAEVGKAWMFAKLLEVNAKLESMKATIAAEAAADHTAAQKIIQDRGNEEAIRNATPQDEQPSSSITTQPPRPNAYAFFMSAPQEEDNLASSSSSISTIGESRGQSPQPLPPKENGVSSSSSLSGSYVLVNKQMGMTLEELMRELRRSSPHLPSQTGGGGVIIHRIELSESEAAELKQRKML